MATIKDIAREAGVGLGTVSRVLNGSAQVSPDTAQKVMEIAGRLNYRPNAAARALVRGEFTRHTLGVTLPIAVHPFYLEILKGIYDAVTKKGYNILIFNLGGESEAVYEHLLQENLPGILIVAQSLPPAVRAQLISQHISFHFIDYHSDEDTSFYIDNHSGGRTAASYFLSKGYQKIAYVGENADTQQQSLRFSGFRDTLAESGISLIQDIRIPINEADSYQATRELLQHYQPDAIFYFCDELAFGGLRARSDAGASVCILGYDDREPSRYMNLSTLSQPAFEMGYQAAHSLIESLNHPTQKSESKCFDPLLIERNS